MPVLPLQWLGSSVSVAGRAHFVQCYCGTADSAGAIVLTQFIAANTRSTNRTLERTRVETMPAADRIDRTAIFAAEEITRGA